MSGTAVKIVRGLITLASVGITVVTGILDKKELNAKITKKVTEEVANQLAKRES